MATYSALHKKQTYLSCFNFFYYRSICIIDNGASKRRARSTCIIEVRAS